MAQRRIVVVQDEQAAETERQIMIGQGYTARKKKLALVQWENRVSGSLDGSPNCWVVTGDRP